MKAIKILTFVIIGILIIGIGVGAYIYFYTDTFKTNKEIFYKYASKEQLAKIIDFDSINQTLTRLKSEKSEQNIDTTISMTMDDQNVLNNATISLKGKTDPTENKSEISLAFGNENKKDVLQIDGIYNKEKVGISFKDITNKYVALENKNLNQFWEKLGLNDLNMDKIEFSNYDSQIDKNIEKAKAVVTEFFTKIAEQTSKEQYSNLGKTQIELNGAAVEAKAYELKLNNEEILDSELMMYKVIDKNRNYGIIKEIFKGHISISLTKYASGNAVILITSQPCEVKNFDSAFVENLGPLITTTVPVSWTLIPNSFAVSTANLLNSGQ